MIWWSGQLTARARCTISAVMACGAGSTGRIGSVTTERRAMSARTPDATTCRPSGRVSGSRCPMMPPYSSPSARSRCEVSSATCPSGTVPARKTPSGNVKNRNSIASAPLRLVRSNASRMPGEARRMRQAPATGANRPPRRNGCGEAILQISPADCKCLTLRSCRSAPAYGGRSPPPHRSGSRRRGAANPRASAADLRPDSLLHRARTRANPIGATRGL